MIGREWPVGRLELKKINAVIDIVSRNLILDQPGKNCFSRPRWTSSY